MQRRRSAFAVLGPSLVVAGLLACSKGRAPTSPKAGSSIDVGAVDASAAQAAEPAATSSSAPAVAPRTSSFVAPPSGEYAITTEVVADTCGAGAPTAVTLFVAVKQQDGKTTGNFPLPQPGVSGLGVARADDVRLDPPEPFSRKANAAGAQCPTYDLITRGNVLESSADRIRIAYVREYGDASGCARPAAPSKCKLEYVYTYALARKYCDARCSALRTPSDGGVDVTCKCP